MKSALTNEAKKQEQTFGLRSVWVCAHVFVCVGIQFPSKCKAELWQCLFSCDRHSACTGYNSCPIYPLWFLGKCVHVHVRVFAYVCQAYWVITGNSTEEHENANRQMEARFIWPRVEKHTWSGFQNNKRNQGHSWWSTDTCSVTMELFFWWLQALLCPGNCCLLEKHSFSNSLNNPGKVTRLMLHFPNISVLKILLSY